ncbi:hypothetical protein GBAR_LOCUS18554 [Geodia barretti]|uniref:Cyclic nucleotide-binding domain-containing protein n=1 Tax=Geodia barretti TaxID=519541 RepID=A0AA35WXY5_GEOBA|nr:hypothetical protein GBAR_LOCUS18554 [Geodia barretti]
METSATRTRLVLPQLEMSPAPRAGHGTCREGVVPSGLRKARHGGTKVTTIFVFTFDQLAAETRREQQRVEIDYDKLRELCLQVGDERDGGGEHTGPANREQRHRQFMSNYRLLLRETPADGGRTAAKAPPPDRQCDTSCSSSSISVDCSHQVDVEAIHGRRATSVQKSTVETNTRLKAMLNILRKLPLQRDVGEVKQLSNHLSRFPSLLPPSDKDRPSVLVGVAARCLLETIPKKGFSLPDKGGVYLILQGSVQRKTKDEATQEIISTQLHEGDSFGAMEENFITNQGKNCEAAERRERLSLISSCPALSGVSSSVTGAMASDITGRQFLLTPVMIGRLGPGLCVGEALLRGSERQPYKVQTGSRVRIGWVPSTTVTMNEVGKLIPADKDLSIPVPTKDTVRHQYAKELMALHWRQIKSDILSEAKGDQVPQPEPVGRWKI